jgi:membrane-bound lytic murein transglycosylase A
VTLRASLLSIACVALLAGCAATRPRESGPLVGTSARQLPAFADDLDPGSLREAVERTLPAYERAGEWTAIAAARRLLEIYESSADPQARRDAIRKAFRVARLRDPLLLTAYYEPELAGRLVADEVYRYPLYARPPNLVDLEPAALDPSCQCRRTSGRVENGRLVAYLSRGEIDAGALAGQGLEIGWVDDPIALFSLHVQGSGRLRLEDGTLLGVRFAGSNGRPYTSLGRTLVARGMLPEGQASMPDIRRVLATLPPEQRAALLAVNERYTFFRVAEGGPIGSLGVELTPGRSIATDPRLVPPGTLAYLVTPSARRFVVSQDTGGAIVGAHADLFLGAGPFAEERAGRTREKGTLYLLLPPAEDAR